MALDSVTSYYGKWHVGNFTAKIIRAHAGYGYTQEKLEALRQLLIPITYESSKKLRGIQEDLYFDEASMCPDHLPGWEIAQMLGFDYFGRRTEPERTTKASRDNLLYITAPKMCLKVWKHAYSCNPNCVRKYLAKVSGNSCKRFAQVD